MELNYLLPYSTSRYELLESDTNKAIWTISGKVPVTRRKQVPHREVRRKKHMLFAPGGGSESL